MFEAARALAERTLREAGADAASRADYLFRLCTARHPDDWERDELVQEYEQHLAAYRAEPAAAVELTQVGDIAGARCGGARPIGRLDHRGQPGVELGRGGQQELNGWGAVAMTPLEQYLQAMTRRHFFGRTALGLGTAALASLLPDRPAWAGGHGLPELPHFAPTAKRAIYLFMAGAPSQLDMFDYKPVLNDHFGEDLRSMSSIQMGQRLTTMTSGQSTLPLAPSKYKFQQYGENGAWVSELLPYHTRMIDDLAVIKTVWTEAINHDPAITYICTGHQLPGRASLGAWLSYGLGYVDRRSAVLCRDDPHLDRP